MSISSAVQAQQVLKQTLIYLEIIECIFQGIPCSIALTLIQIVEGNTFGQGVLPIILIVQQIIEPIDRLAVRKKEMRFKSFLLHYHRVLTFVLVQDAEPTPVVFSQEKLSS